MNKSDELWVRAQHYLGGHFQTLSKNPCRFPMGVAPKFLESGEGAYVWDVDGNKFVDLVAGLGPILLGHSDPSVNNAVIDQIKQGTSFSLGNPIEVEVAELIVNSIHSVDMVRFAKNGKDVTEAAMKIARHETQKPHAVFVGYNGGFSDYLSTTDKRYHGTLPELKLYNHQVKWGDYEQLQSLIHQINTPDAGVRGGLACIMAEVPPPIYGDLKSEESYALYLKHIEKTAHDNGALFILDEVVTGWRKHPGGAQRFYNVIPDLSCFSKAMGNGHSVAAVGGQRDLMSHFDDGLVFLSTTFGGETTGLAAASVVISAIQYTQAWERLHFHGKILGDELLAIIQNRKAPVTLIGDHCRMLMKFHDVGDGVTSDVLKTFWQQEMIKRGILAGGPIFPMVCYTPEIVYKITGAAGEVLEYMVDELMHGNILDRLECPVITDVFGQRYETKKSPMVW